jgi:DeoR/GlpR family transcriptional regulator of sugar metabolism
MEKLLSVADLMDRYQCSRQTAIRYMQKMEHQEKPYMVRQSVVEAWDRSRTVRPAAEIRTEMIRAKLMRRMA